MNRIGHQQMRVTVKAAEKGEVGGQRRDICVEGIIDFYGDNIVRADIDIGSGVENESCETALVFAQVIAVHIDIRDQESAVEFKEEAPAGIGRVHWVVASVPADAAVVVVAAVLAVEVIPRVREIYCRPSGVIEGGVLGAGDVLADESPPRIEENIHPVAGWRDVGLGSERKGYAEEEKASGSQKSVWFRLIGRAGFHGGRYSAACMSSGIILLLLSQTSLFRGMF